MQNCRLIILENCTNVDQNAHKSLLYTMRACNWIIRQFLDWEIFWCLRGFVAKVGLGQAFSKWWSSTILWMLGFWGLGLKDFSSFIEFIIIWLFYKLENIFQKIVLSTLYFTPPSRTFIHHVYTAFTHNFHIFIISLISHFHPQLRRKCHWIIFSHKIYGSTQSSSVKCFMVSL